MENSEPLTLVHWYQSTTQQTFADSLQSFSGKLVFIAFFIHNSPSSLSQKNNLTATQVFSEYLKDLLLAFLSHHVELGLSCRCKVALLSHFTFIQYSSGHAGNLSSSATFLSLAATKEVLMSGDGTGSDRISPMTLYGVFLKNKVNKTWNAEPRVLIICL